MDTFLGPYVGNERIVMGTAPDGTEYWVEVKKYLSVAEAEVAEAHQVNTTKRDPNGNLTFDALGRLFEYTLVAILGWNLTDAEGKVLPLDHDPEKERFDGRPSPRRVALRNLPQHAYDRIAVVVSKYNNRDPEADASFRGGSEQLSARGEVDPSGDREVPEGEAVVGEPGTPPGPKAAKRKGSEGKAGDGDADAADGELPAGAEVIPDAGTGAPDGQGASAA